MLKNYLLIKSIFMANTNSNVQKLCAKFPAKWISQLCPLKYARVPE
jgi:hypothetical protein